MTPHHLEPAPATLLTLNHMKKELQIYLERYFNIEQDATIQTECAETQTIIKNLFDTYDDVIQLESKLYWLEKNGAIDCQESIVFIRLMKKDLLLFHQHIHRSDVLSNFLHHSVGKISHPGVDHLLIETILKKTIFCENDFAQEEIRKNKNIIREIKSAFDSEIGRFSENWIFCLSRNELEFFSHSFLKLCHQNYLKNSTTLLRKFRDQQPPSEYAISLSPNLYTPVLRYGPRHLRKKIFDGLSQLRSLSRNPAELQTDYFLNQSLKAWHNISKVLGFVDFCDFKKIHHLSSQSLNTLAGHYRQILRALQQSASSLWSDISFFAQKRDRLPAIEAYDLDYYSELFRKEDPAASLAYTEIFEIQHSLITISDQLSSLLGVHIQTKQTDFSSSTPEYGINLIYQDIIIAEICCQLDIGTRHSKSSKSMTIIYPTKSEHVLRCQIKVSAISEDNLSKISFHNLVELYTKIAEAAAEAMWLQRGWRPSLLKMISPDIKQILPGICRSLACQVDFVKNCLASLTTNKAQALLESFSQAEQLGLFHSVQIAYFDCLLHSADFMGKSEAISGLSPKQLWEQVSSEYHIHGFRCPPSYLNPALYGYLFSGTSSLHARLIGRIYGAQIAHAIIQSNDLRSTSESFCAHFFALRASDKLILDLEERFLRERFNAKDFINSMQLNTIELQPSILRFNPICEIKPSQEQYFSCKPK